MSSDSDSDSDVSLIASDNEPEQIEEPTEDQEPENPEAPEPENPEAPEAEEEKKPVKPKRVIRNPRPRLNAETLKGKRGLTALESYFERVKFKGRGYEEQDLGVILKTYEYWCHRLFPKFPFDECLDKIEQLGKKRPVITHVRRIRTDLVLADVPVENVNQDNVSDSEDININDAFDDLMAPTTSLADPVPVPEITEEQMERMRQNKEAAERKRRERLEQERQKALEFPEDESDFIPASTSSQNFGLISQNDSQQSGNSLQEQDLNSEMVEVEKDKNTSLSQESTKEDELSMEPMDTQKENVPPPEIEDEDF